MRSERERAEGARGRGGEAVNNFHIDITSHYADLRAALSIALGHHGDDCAGFIQTTIRTTRDNPGGVWGAQGKGAVPSLILLWHDNGLSDTEPAARFRFPVDLRASELEPITRAWLDKQDLGDGPDLDGDLSRGFRLWNEAWGHVAGNHYAICAVRRGGRRRRDGDR